MEASLELQIYRLHQMKSIVEDFATMSEERMKAIESMLDDLASMGFPKEIAERYRYHYLYDDKEIMDGLIKEIREEHFDFIEKKIQQLTEVGGIK